MEPPRRPFQTDPLIAMDRRATFGNRFVIVLGSEKGKALSGSHELNVDASRSLMFRVHFSGMPVYVH
jgi:hypothetical protein